MWIRQLLVLWLALLPTLAISVERDPRGTDWQVRAVWDVGRVLEATWWR